VLWHLEPNFDSNHQAFTIPDIECIDPTQQKVKNI
jgi:hypothetical protein